MKKRSKAFDKDYSPYGTYNTSEGFGDADEWAESFKARMSPEEIKTILGDDNPWAVLGLQPGAKISEIKKAFFKLAKETHLDHNPSKDGSEFRKIRAAYEKLT